jgi:hypothetical protein
LIVHIEANSTEAIDRIEKAIRSRFPRILHIYIEAKSITSPSRSVGESVAARHL